MLVGGEFALNVKNKIICGVLNSFLCLIIILAVVAEWLKKSECC